MNEKGSQNFIKLDRQISDHKIMKDPLAFQLFVYCILKAAYYPINDEGVNVPRGSFMTTIRELSTNLKCSYNSIVVRLRKISVYTSGSDYGSDYGSNLLTHTRVGNRLMVTVVHYDKWQGKLEKKYEPRFEPKGTKSSSLPLNKKKEKKEEQKSVWDSLD